MFLNCFRKSDKVLTFGVVLLMIMGLIAILSVSYSGNEINFINFKKQLLFSIVGLLAMLTVSSFDYRVVKNYTGVSYAMILFVLVGVLIFGAITKGTNSWFDFGVFSLQPSEFSKIVVIVVLAKYLSEVGIAYNIYRKILISGIYMIIPAVLILKQPDLGSTLVVFFIWFAMLSVFGLKKKHIILFVILGIIISILSWNFALQTYQKDRIMTFVNPQTDPLGSGYNVIQSIIAVGSGSIWGKGIGHGSQSQLEFLPEKHTDFIFAVIAEEMGFIGSAMILIIFTIIFWRLTKIAREAQDNFGRLLVLGVLFMLFFHMIVNIGMNMGVMPVTGIPLPFISYGGSSLITFLISIGLVQSIYINGRRYRFDTENEIL